MKIGPRTKQGSMFDKHLKEISSLAGTMTYEEIAGHLAYKYPHEYPDGVNTNTVYAFCRVNGLCGNVDKSCHQCTECRKVRHTDKKGYLVCTVVMPWRLIKENIKRTPHWCPDKKRMEDFHD